jgi:hypothetical protein
MFLHVLGYNRRFRVIHNTWRKSTEIISHYFKQVLFAIGELREKNDQAAIYPHSHQNQRQLPMVSILQGEQLNIILHHIVLL